MTGKQHWFSTKQRGEARGSFRRPSRPVSIKSVPTSEKSVSFNFNHDWQSGKTLAECNTQMLQHGFLSDVIFYVGKGKRRESIKAHKFILVARSSVFFNRFCGGQNLDDVTNVDDIEPNIFHQLLGFIYTDEVELTTKTVIPLLYAAKKYKLERLVTLCCKKLTEDLSADNVSTLLEQSHEFKEAELERSCLQFIYKNAHDVFKSQPFLTLCTSCLTKILQSDDLEADENKVYEAVYDWSTKRCKKQKLSPTPDNRNRVLGKIIYLVRFPVLDLEYFSKNVVAQGLLTKDEIIQLFKYFHSRTSPSVGPFNSRRRALTRVVRFETTSGAWNVGNYVFDSIRFQSSRDITLDGILVYGCFEDMAHYNITVKILNEKLETVIRTDSAIETDESTGTYDILFNNGIGLSAMTWYTIALHMVGPQTKRGVCGKQMVYCQQVQFMFQNSGLTQNCTTEKEGQIPGIIFH